MLERHVKILSDGLKKLQKENESLRKKVELLETQNAELEARLIYKEQSEKAHAGRSPSLDMG